MQMAQKMLLEKNAIIDIRNQLRSKKRYSEGKEESKFSHNRMF